MSPGIFHCLALDAQGRVFSCGNNKSGELGRTGDAGVFAEIENAPEEPIKSISAGFAVSFIITESGKVYAFGSSRLSTLKQNTAIPTLVKKLNFAVKQVEQGLNYAMVVAEDGRLFSWGDNTFQQTGTGSKSKQIAKPTEVSYFSNQGLRV